MVLAEPLLRLAQMEAILFLTVLLQRVVVEVAVLTLMYLAHQHQPQAVLEAVVFGQVHRAVLPLHQDKALLVALALVLLTIPEAVAAVLLRLVVMPQTQAQALVVMAGQGLHLACLEFLQHTLEAVEAVVINMAQPPVLVVQVAAALVVSVEVLEAQG